MELSELSLTDNNFKFLILNILTYDAIHDFKYDRIKDKKIVLDIINKILYTIEERDSQSSLVGGSRSRSRSRSLSQLMNFHDIRETVIRDITNETLKSIYRDFVPIILLNAIGGLTSQELRFSSFDTSNLLFVSLNRLKNRLERPHSIDSRPGIMTHVSRKMSKSPSPRSRSRSRSRPKSRKLSPRLSRDISPRTRKKPVKRAMSMSMSPSRTRSRTRSKSMDSSRTSPKTRKYKRLKTMQKLLFGGEEDSPPPRSKMQKTHKDIDSIDFSPLKTHRDVIFDKFSGGDQTFHLKLIKLDPRRFSETSQENLAIRQLIINKFAMDTELLSTIDMMKTTYRSIQASLDSVKIRIGENTHEIHLYNIDFDAIVKRIDDLLMHLNTGATRATRWSNDTFDAFLDLIYNNNITFYRQNFDTDNEDAEYIYYVLDLAATFANIDFDTSKKDNSMLQKNHSNNLLDLIANIGIKYIANDGAGSDDALQMAQIDNLRRLNISKFEENLFNAFKKNIERSPTIPTNLTYTDNIRDDLIKANNDKRFIVCNAGKNHSKYTEYKVGSISNIIDPALPPLGGTNPQFNALELGKMDVRIKSKDDPSSYYHVVLDYNPASNKTQLSLDVNISSIGDSFKLRMIYPAKPESMTHTKKALSVGSVYMNVLEYLYDTVKRADQKFSWAALLEDRSFAQKFVETYTAKSLGDFMQELNAVLVNGGYTRGYPKYSGTSASEIAQFSSANSSPPGRLFTANDRLSILRFWFLRHSCPELGPDVINQNSSGLYDA